MTDTTPVIAGWELLTEDEAADAAIDEFGQDPTTSVAYCGCELGETGNRRVKTAKRKHP
ncbi:MULTISPECIES: hypothetical protein [unclassified Mesorhizobium]|uniref:hypothetical protein n=1 Tax=unclassified Mesorhizobium TaxID=325217 RepID=UPI0016764913|nr:MULTISPECIES: hypothetical protein [unclassified Mesorhizobium]